MRPPPPMADLLLMMKKMTHIELVEKFMDGGDMAGEVLRSRCHGREMIARTRLTITELCERVYGSCRVQICCLGKSSIPAAVA